MRLVAEHAEGGWFVGDEELGAVFTGAGTITANGWSPPAQTCASTT
ncbi:hypothetical protein [Curtobacterium citreum]|nr:hypothetical protein [Curtobacterium citreum]